LDEQTQKPGLERGGGTNNLVHQLGGDGGPPNPVGGGRVNAGKKVNWEGNFLKKKLVRGGAHVFCFFFPELAEMGEFGKKG